MAWGLGPLFGRNETLWASAPVVAPWQFPEIASTQCGTQCGTHTVLAGLAGSHPLESKTLS